MTEPLGATIDAAPVKGSGDASWFGHPAQLARLFTTEAMERFGYYGMRALLTLYLAQHFLFSDTTTTGLYGGFTALVYLTPLIGGMMADRFLGSKRSVKFGAILMSLGYAILCFSSTGGAAKPYAMIEGTRYEVTVEGSGEARKQYVSDQGATLRIKGNEDKTVSLLREDGSEARRIAAGGFEAGGERNPLYTFLLITGLAFVTVGNGFFKPNISTIVGELYEQGDRRRDAGFTIFYMGINLGSLFSQILCPLLAVGMGSWGGLGWWAGFALAAAGMAVSWLLFQFDGGKLDGYGERPADANPSRDMLVYIGAVLAIPLAYLLFANLMAYVKPPEGSGLVGYIMSLPIMGKIMFGTFLVAIPGILLWSWQNGDRREFEMMVAAIVLITFNTVFWTLFEQAGSSLTLFADRNTDMSVFGLFSITAGQTQFFNAFFIVVLAPLFSMLWGALARRGLEPGIPVKFGVALVGVGAGFLFLVWGAQFADANYKVGLWWLAGLYMIHSMAELCISPVGLSMVTKLSIARIVGLMMGTWFLSIAVAQYVAGVVAQFASVETVGGEVTNLKVSLDTYVGVFQTIGEVSAVIGLVLLALSVPLKRLMHGVK
ncbi:MAG: peptide MFS transporter [Sphingomonadales bacterium]|uniref:peptide MFS transporter n=1 Tax=unclassified Novosphingobium TaxID=2644732 RepID=UPI0006B91F71|nr:MULTISPECIES: peptide MFS transporter [unclassified Novosphingobium]KPF87778.1 amino acid transporter [Novosphingobium sp. AAP93]MBU6396207.1 peptide MFS transporter [Sphingomonadales bacterium]